MMHQSGAETAQANVGHCLGKSGGEISVIDRLKKPACLEDRSGGLMHHAGS